MGILNGDIFGPADAFNMLFWPTVALIAITYAIGTRLTRRPW